MELCISSNKKFSINNDNKKIYDVITYNKEDFFLDPEFNLIWNNKKEIVGIYQNKNNLFFWITIDNIINEIRYQMEISHEC
jgi:chemotaxis signal transduction protein